MAADSKTLAKDCAEAWQQVCPQKNQFTVECAMRLTPASQFTPSLYNTATGPLKGLGLGFERPLTKDDDLATVRRLLQYVALERVGLPGLRDVPEGWDVFGRPPRSRIEQDDDAGQRISVEAWDGAALKVTVAGARVFALEGRDGNRPIPPGMPAPAETYFEIRCDLRATLALTCALDV